MESKSQQPLFSVAGCICGRASDAASDIQKQSLGGSRQIGDYSDDAIFSDDEQPIGLAGRRYQRRWICKYKRWKRINRRVSVGRRLRRQLQRRVWNALEGQSGAANAKGQPKAEE